MEETLQLRTQLQGLLKAGGFELRKWASNLPAWVEGIPSEHLRLSAASDPLLLDRDSIIKVLGLGWNPTNDALFYAVRLTDTALTKRSILSQMARIFDPLACSPLLPFRGSCFFDNYAGFSWMGPADSRCTNCALAGITGSFAPFV